jgi:hypothetical protein
MSFSRYAATIPSFQQVLGAIAGLLDIAEAFCVEKGIAAQDLTQARLAADMFPSPTGSGPRPRTPLVPSKAFECVSSCPT